jgi:outer membrane receptor protein involved in Fe transport
LRQSGPGYSKGDALPETPPFEARIAAVYRVNIQSTRITCRWILRHTGSADNQLPALSPLLADAASYTRHDFSVTLTRKDAITVDLSIHNIFDTNYYPYLNPPTSAIRPASGDLAPGDRVPGPGREIVFSCRLAF